MKDQRGKHRAVRLVALAMGLLLIATTAACGDDDDGDKAADPGTGTQTTFPAGTTMARIQEAGKIKVGVKKDQPGFGLENPTTGEVEGFDADLARLIAKAIGPNVEVEFVKTVSGNREDFIQKDVVDLVIATYTINDKRKEQVAFAGPYFIAGQDIMVRSDDDSIKSVTDLNGKEVCTVKGSTSAPNVEAAAPQAKITLVDEYSDCVTGVRAKRYDALTTDNAILLGYVVNGDGDFKLVDNRFSDEPYGIGVLRSDDAFRTFVNDQLQKMYDDGSWAKAFEDTLGKIGLSTPTPPPLDRYVVSGDTVEATTTSTASTTTTTHAVS